ncbi:hypothetical protein U9M48_004686 [Paspalum notatum var. saurae]|uniref:Uncharacterized protein n=1 Tax=Paspalum notatum var. saurae TaxID=547442 RepID=A0AAQ3SJ98_PASNO
MAAARLCPALPRHHRSPAPTRGARKSSRLGQNSTPHVLPPPHHVSRFVSAAPLFKKAPAATHRGSRISSAGACGGKRGGFFLRWQA